MWVLFCHVKWDSTLEYPSGGVCHVCRIKKKIKALFSFYQLNKWIGRQYLMFGMLMVSTFCNEVLFCTTAYAEGVGPCNHCALAMHVTFHLIKYSALRWWYCGVVKACLLIFGCIHMSRKATLAVVAVASIADRAVLVVVMQRLQRSLLWRNSACHASIAGRLAWLDDGGLYHGLFGPLELSVLGV